MLQANDKVVRINGLFQQWQSLLNNRAKREQSRKCIVQGVRPINAAIAQGLVIDAVLYREGHLSDWAKGTILKSKANKSYELSAELMKLLGEKDDGTPELLLVVKTPITNLNDIQFSKLQSKFVLVLDRPQNPGNIGAVVRSADALGAAMVIITGHAPICTIRRQYAQAAAHCLHFRSLLLLARRLSWSGSKNRGLVLLWLAYLKMVRNIFGIMT